MDISLFNYNLPDELIAQSPNRSRDQSKLLVLNRQSGDRELISFKDIIKYFNKGDCLVVNNTKVFKARLIGHRSSGGEVEVFLVRKDTSGMLEWEALVKPSRRLSENEEIFFYVDSFSDKLSVTLFKYHGEGRWRIRFHSQKSEEKIIEMFGHVPLPLYIKRDDTVEDINRYQTIFAKADQSGAVAAPTAGFHFTDSLMDALKSRGVTVAEVTLHVGPGTFKPVSVDKIENHSVDPEYAELSQKTADIINQTRKSGGRLFVVGTTSTRTIESAEVDNDGNILPFAKFVDLYIQPGFRFRFVDHLITNFHLPKSSLLILISAFAEREKMLDAYQFAIENQLRFYSYGDAMLIM